MWHKQGYIEEWLPIIIMIVCRYCVLTFSYAVFYYNALFYVCLLPCLTKNTNGHVLLYCSDFLWNTEKTEWALHYKNKLIFNEFIYYFYKLFQVILVCDR